MVIQIDEVSMLEIGAFEAKNRLSALLERVERGEEILITRRGQPVAKLVPARPVPDQAGAVAAAERLLARSKTTRLAGLKIKDLIGEGRL
jgi:prevent-host-death family protein